MNDQDQELVTALAQVFEPRDRAIEELRGKVKGLQERSSRAPGYAERASLEPPATQPLILSPTEALSANTGFASWLKSPLSHQSHFEAAVRFEVKTGTAATPTVTPTPIMGVGTPIPYPLPMLGPPLPQLRLGQVVPRTPIDGGPSVGFTRESSFTPAADLVPETTLKPMSGLTFTNVIVPFHTVATYSKTSLQAMQDLPTLTVWVEQRLSYAVLLKEEQYLLNDPDAGLLALASTLDPAYAPGAGATQLDVIACAVSELEAQGYQVDAIVMNGVDINKARLLKTTYGEYLWASPDSPIGTAAMWAVPVIRTPNIAAGTFLVAALKQSVILFQREMLTVVIAFQNEDDFVRNLATIRAEERVAVSVLLPKGLIKGTFTGTVATASTHESSPGIAPPSSVTHKK